MAKGFRERGDTTNAIAKLQQATTLDPGNAEALAELAMTYESMQLFNRSNEIWRRLQALGPNVGPLYELADLKLRVGVPAGNNTVTAEAASAAAGVHTDDLGVIPRRRQIAPAFGSTTSDHSFRQHTYTTRERSQQSAAQASLRGRGAHSSLDKRTGGDTRPTR
jgi:tetratricopeptide (TPR) repeat protein